MMLCGQTRPQLSEKEQGLLSYLFSSYFLLQVNEPLQTQNEKNKGKKIIECLRFMLMTRGAAHFFFLFFKCCRVLAHQTNSLQQNFNMVITTI